MCNKVVIKLLWKLKNKSFNLLRIPKTPALHKVQLFSKNKADLGGKRRERAKPFGYARFSLWQNISGKFSPTSLPGHCSCSPPAPKPAPLL